MKNNKVEERRTTNEKESLPVEKDQKKKPFFVRLVAFILRWL
jgi:hypothetical protein